MQIGYINCCYSNEAPNKDVCITTKYIVVP